MTPVAWFFKRQGDRRGRQRYWKINFWSTLVPHTTAMSIQRECQNGSREKVRFRLRVGNGTRSNIHTKKIMSKWRDPLGWNCLKFVVKKNKFYGEAIQNFPQSVIFELRNCWFIMQHPPVYWHMNWLDTRNLFIERQEKIFHWNFKIRLFNLPRRKSHYHFFYSFIYSFVDGSLSPHKGSH